MFILFSSIFSSNLAGAEAGWVPVSKSQKAIHQIEEDDQTIWVVFAKDFGSERILVRFPEDPIYQYQDGQFNAYATQLGSGELTLLVREKQGDLAEGESRVRYASYFDPDTGFWVREKHVETRRHQYVLRVVNPSENSSVFPQFANSFEVESGSVF